MKICIIRSERLKAVDGLDQKRWEKKNLIQLFLGLKVNKIRNFFSFFVIRGWRIMKWYPKSFNENFDKSRQSAQLWLIFHSFLQYFHTCYQMINSVFVDERITNCERMKWKSKIIFLIQVHESVRNFHQIFLTKKSHTIWKLDIKLPKK